MILLESMASKKNISQAIPALSISHLSKTIWHKKEVVFKLSYLTLNIAKGDFFALLGPNGSGKTTLINLMLGLMTPDEGEVKILGKNPIETDALLKVNFLFTEQEEPWSLKVKDILNFYAEIYAIPRKKEKIKQLTELLNITNKMHQQSHKLSSGERTRVMIARALINEPELLILDEPTHNLDAYTAEKLRNFLVKLNKEKKTTIIFTSHNVQEVEKVAKTIGFIKSGKLRKVLPLAEIKKKYGSVRNFIKKMEK